MDATYKTKGIVLHTIRHNEKGIVIHIYTQKWGRQSYYSTIAANGRVRIGGNRVALEPLSLLDFTGREPLYGSMHKITEAKNTFLPYCSASNIVKASISLFISEVVYKFVKENEPNPLLFDYLSHSIRTLDNIEEGIANYHLYFMVNLAAFLGFAPSKNYEEDRFFDLIKGEYVVIKPNHDHYIDQQTSKKLYEISNIDISELANVKLNRATRVYLLGSIINFINIHSGTNIRISSLEMLSELF